MPGMVFSMLVLVCLNVSIRVYSRTVTRQAEIAVRTALGAGRGRIVAQLFLEALVLSAIAAAVGVGVAELALRHMANATLALASKLPFWLSFHLSPQAVLYAGALAVLAAAIVGVAPALQATRRDVHSDLRALGAGGSGMRLGPTWTLLIVAQVGCAVALLPAAVAGAWADVRAGFSEPGFKADEFLSAQLDMDGDASAFASRQEELMRLIENEPRVSGVTFAMVNPGEERAARIEKQGALTETREVGFNRVDAGFFRAFDVPVLAGRGFTQGDIPPAGESRVVVVNQSFAQQVFGGDALGKSVRYAADDETEPGPWYEIVGIISDFPAGQGPEMDASKLKLYHPIRAGQAYPATMAAHVRDGAPSTFAARLREIAAAVDPELHVQNILGLDEALRRDQWLRRMEAAVLGAVVFSVLMLSSAGIYSLMSITVSQRRKEIGIRIALGANRTRIVASIFARALGQLALGAAVGAAFAAALEAQGNLMRGNGAVVLPAVALFMMAVGLAAAHGPARRCLAIEPTEALREQ
jgi:predicted permease